MKELLKNFWEWFRVSQEDYENGRYVYVPFGMEDDFTDFYQLTKCAERIVDENLMSDDSLYDLLTVMGLDNEGEDVLCYIEENSKEAQFDKIIRIGVTHRQCETRWQVAELIYRRKSEKYYEFLVILSDDSDEYVRRRARNCIQYLREELGIIL